MAVSKRRIVYFSLLFSLLSIFSLLSALAIGRAVSDGSLASCGFKDEFELLEVAAREFHLSMRVKLEKPIHFISYVEYINTRPSGENYGFVNFESQSDDARQWFMYIDEDCTQYIERE